MIYQLANNINKQDQILIKKIFCKTFMKPNSILQLKKEHICLTNNI